MAKNKAYTLIELIVVISIIVLISGLSLAYYNDFTARQKFDEETEKIISVLELAKKKAFVSDLQNFSCQEFFGYTISFTPDSYSMKLICTPDCGINCTRTFTVSSPNFVITATDSPTLTFKPMYFGIEPAAGLSIILTDNRLNKCKKINISPASVISKELTCP